MLHGVKPPALKLVLSLLLLGCGVLLINAVMQAWAGNGLPLLVALLLWLPLAWGLWQLRPWARRLAVILLWLVILVLPIGIINPFFAIDRTAAAAPPLWQLALPVFAVVTLALFMVHILDKHRAAFGAAR